MPSNCNNPDQSCGSQLYMPPHLRPGYVDTLNNNSTKYTDKNPKMFQAKNGRVTNFGNGQTLKYNNVSSLENGQSLKNTKVSNFGNGQSFKNTRVTNLGNGEFFSKLYISPPKHNQYDFGISPYFDWKFKGSRLEYKKKLEESNTLYIGNLNTSSTESDIHKLFSKVGTIVSIIMGVEKYTMAPGGFCFIEFKTRADTEQCMNLMQNVLLDGNKLFIDWDAGFVEGRQYKRIKRKGPNQSLRPRVMHQSSSKVNNSSTNEHTDGNHL